VYLIGSGPPLLLGTCFSRQAIEKLPEPVNDSAKVALSLSGQFSPPHIAPNPASHQLPSASAYVG